jgi:hypothetical protein
MTRALTTTGIATRFVFPKTLGVPAASVDHRLAPKHPHPETLEKCRPAFVRPARLQSKGFTR